MASKDLKREQPLPPKDYVDDSLAQEAPPELVNPAANERPTVKPELAYRAKDKVKFIDGPSSIPSQPAEDVLREPADTFNASSSRTKTPQTQGSSRPSGSDSQDRRLRASGEKAFAESSEWASSATLDISPEQLKAYLLEKGRVFLHSPEIRWQDDDKKRKFLLGKGLDKGDVEVLMEEAAPPPPPLPARTYPGAKESRLLSLLRWFLKFTKVYAYAVGSSAVAAFFYWWLLLPRISSTMAAATEIRAQRLGQMKRLNLQMGETKQIREVESIAELSTTTGKLSPEKSHEHLKNSLADLRASIDALRSARQADHSREETFDNINSLTGFVSSRLYTPPEFGVNGKVVKKPVLGPVEDEVRSEIRALKGLALNRRSFVASALRKDTTTPPAPSIA